MHERHHRRLLPLLALLVPSVLGACSSTPVEPEPTWVSGQVETDSDRVLWKVVLLAMDKMDFPQAANHQPTELHALSGWKSDLQPWKGKGHRQMAEVRCVPVGPSRYEVRVRVKRQTNESISRPLDLRYAKWEWADDDVRAAQVLLQHVRSYLDPRIEPAEERDALEELLERAGRGAHSSR